MHDLIKQWRALNQTFALCELGKVKRERDRVLEKHNRVVMEWNRRGEIGW